MRCDDAPSHSSWSESDDVVLAAEVDLSEIVGDYNTDEAEDSGMQIATVDEMQDSSGFEDVDLSEIQNED